MPAETAPPRLTTAQDLDEVVANFNTLIEWAKDKPSGIGYFAVMYKRATIAMDAAIKAEEFEQPDVMAKFVMFFAQRYFDALNAYRDPQNQLNPTQVWLCHFVGLEHSGPIVFQHLLTAVDAHINLDLGIAASSVGSDNMDGLRADFDQVNRVLASQVQSVLTALGDVSPALERIRIFISDDTEVLAINKLLIVFRDLAWQFALSLASAGDDERQGMIDERDLWATRLGRVYLRPPGLLGATIWLIGLEESRDVEKIITRLDQDSDKPVPTNQEYLANL